MGRGLFGVMRERGEDGALWRGVSVNLVNDIHYKRLL